MKKLFLASIASLTLDKITELLPDEPSKLNAVFIPTASNLYTDRTWTDKDRDKLKDMGFTVRDLDLVDKKKEEIEEALKNTDVVCVAGGNTFYLLEKMKESGFDEVIKKRVHEGVIYIGSSAGSAVVCPTIGMVEGLDDPKDAPNLISYDALGIIDFIIFLHYGDEDYAEKYKPILERWTQKGYDYKYVKNNEALVINGDQCTLVES
jgi:dipeptidase E